jgi:hypothetical protein
LVRGGASLRGFQRSAGTGKDELILDLIIKGHIRRVLGMTGGKIHGPGGAGELLGINPNEQRRSECFRRTDDGWTGSLSR